MNLTEFSGHITFLLIACSFLVQNILTLRIISILSCITAVIYNFYALEEPLWLVINWNIIFFIIHFANIGLYLYQNRKTDFDKDEQFVYEKVFKDISHTDFAHLMKIGKAVNIKKGSFLMQEGRRCNNVALILKGRVSLLCKNTELSQIEKGSFIGESHLFDTQCHDSQVSVKVIEPLRLIIWHKKDLIRHLRKNAEIQKSFLLVINKNMNEKLKFHAEAI